MIENQACHLILKKFLRYTIYIVNNNYLYIYIFIYYSSAAIFPLYLFINVVLALVLIQWVHFAVAIVVANLSLRHTPSHPQTPREPPFYSSERMLFNLSATRRKQSQKGALTQRVFLAATRAEHVATTGTLWTTSVDKPFGNLA